MPIEIQPPRIRTRESPREIIAADFQSLGEMPIKGGWGYSQEHAVIIDKNDPAALKGVQFDGIGIEYIFVEKRIYEELIIFRPKGNRYSGIKWKLLQQEVTHDNDKTYDVLTFEVTALHESDWANLKAEWEGPNGFRSSNFDVDEHENKRDSLTCRYVTKYWFDITSFS